MAEALAASARAAASCRAADARARAPLADHVPAGWRAGANARACRASARRRRRATWTASSRATWSRRGSRGGFSTDSRACSGSRATSSKERATSAAGAARRGSPRPGVPGRGGCGGAVSPHLELLADALGRPAARRTTRSTTCSSAGGSDAAESGCGLTKGSRCARSPSPTSTPRPHLRGSPRPLPARASCWFACRRRRSTRSTTRSPPECSRTWRSIGSPSSLGRDYAGVVERAGAGATRFAAGDAVSASSCTPSPAVHDGSWAELITVPETNVAARPSGVEAAAAGADAGGRHHGALRASTRSSSKPRREAS